MKKAIKIIGIVFLFLFVIGLIGSAFDSDDSSTSTSSKTNTTADTPSPEKIEEISALDLANFYSENEVAADKYYKGKKLIVSGTIADIGKDILDNAYITLRANSEGFRDVQCSFKDQNVVAELRKGQQVRVKGKCDGLMMNVQLDRCELVY